MTVRNITNWLDGWRERKKETERERVGGWGVKAKTKETEKGKQR